MRASIFYNEPLFEMVEETFAYPLIEMINELVGIFGLYFGFSVISLAPLIKHLISKVLLRVQSNKKMFMNDIIK